MMGKGIAMTVAERLDAEAARRRDTTVRRQPVSQGELIPAGDLAAMRVRFRLGAAMSATAQTLAGRDSKWVCSI